MKKRPGLNRWIWIPLGIILIVLAAYPLLVSRRPKIICLSSDRDWKGQTFHFRIVNDSPRVWSCWTVSTFGGPHEVCYELRPSSDSNYAIYFSHFQFVEIPSKSSLDFVATTSSQDPQQAGVLLLPTSAPEAMRRMSEMTWLDNVQYWIKTRLGIDPDERTWSELTP